MELTNSFEILLRFFLPVFTEPSFQTFRLMMTGWILSTRHRYVTDLIVSSDSTSNGHFTDYLRFFSQAVWDIDHLWKLLAQLIVNSLVAQDAVIILSGDDTLCRKRGLGIFGTGMHHDPLSSSKSKKICHWAMLRDEKDWEPKRMIEVTESYGRMSPPLKDSLQNMKPKENSDQRKIRLRKEARAAKMASDGRTP